MGYLQAVPPNLSTVGDIGYCLAMQENVWGTPHIFATATDAFNATQFRHLDRNFPNVPCPVWFSYFENGINYGHVATNVPGRGVLSSPYKQNGTQQWFADVDECARVLNCTYLGWSEDIANVRVIKQGDTMDDKDITSMYLAAGKSEADATLPANLDYYRGKKPEQLANDLYKSQTADKFYYFGSHYEPDTAALQKQVDNLTAANIKLTQVQPAPDPSITVTQTGLWAAFKKFLGL